MDPVVKTPLSGIERFGITESTEAVVETPERICVGVSEPTEAVAELPVKRTERSGVTDPTEAED